MIPKRQQAFVSLGCCCVRNFKGMISLPPQKQDYFCVITHFGRSDLQQFSGVQSVNANSFSEVTDKQELEEIHFISFPMKQSYRRLKYLLFRVIQVIINFYTLLYSNTVCLENKPNSTRRKRTR